MKPIIQILLVAFCLLIGLAAAVWWFRLRKVGGEEEGTKVKAVTRQPDLWRDFPSAKAAPVLVPHGPYFPLEAKNIDKVVAFDDVVTPSESAYLKALLEKGVTKVSLAKGSTPWLRMLEGRIAKLLQRPTETLEPLEVHLQLPGDEVSPHIDVLEDGGGRQGQRLSTMIVFLNALPPLEEGGRTIFNKLDAGFKPAQGTAIAWNNVVVTNGVAGETDHEMWHMSQALRLDGSSKYTLVAYSREREG